MTDFTLIKNEISTWSNTDNIDLYENMPLDEFYKIAVTGGLDFGKDIDLIMPYIHSAESILEVGAGYGRVLNHIITRGYSKKLACIERSKKLCQWLKSQYQHRATIHEGSIMTIVSQEKYDLILWMWTGLTEFGQLEQPIVLKKLFEQLMVDGKIILDMVPLAEKPLNTLELTVQEHIIQTKYGIDHCYIPSEQQINNYAHQLGLKIIEKISYKSLPERTRLLYVLGR
ncbi:MAG: methyltransferase domain-containing protein [Gammaproteobacteria bacterium]